MDTTSDRIAAAPLPTTRTLRRRRSIPRLPHVALSSRSGPCRTRNRPAQKAVHEASAVPGSSAGMGAASALPGYLSYRAGHDPGAR